MDIKQLRYFVEIAHAGSMREAAARLRIAQPALSRNMAALERDLGQVLFDRHSRGVTPTAAGARLQAHAAELLRRFDDLPARISDNGEALAGQVTIGSSSTLSRMIFGRLVARMRADHPQVAVRLTEGNDDRLLPGIETGRIDVAVLALTGPHPGLTYYPLATEDFCLIGRTDDSWFDSLAGDAVSVTALAGLPLVALDPSAGPRKLLDHAARANGVRLNIAFEAGTSDVIRDFASRGLAFGLLPYSLARPIAPDSGLQWIRVAGLTMTRIIAVKDDRVDVARIAAVVRTLKEEFACLVEDGVFEKRENHTTPT